MSVRIICLGIILGCASPAFGAVWYVDKDNSSSTKDGLSWATAFTTIQPVIDAASTDGGGEIWVAEGTYGETRTSYPHAEYPDINTGSILMKEDVQLYGGFAGNETERSSRDWKSHETILDGSTARGSRNAYHVVVGADDAVLDGFTISGGKCLSSRSGSQFTLSSGAGMYHGTAVNCTFMDNEASECGGGMFWGTATNCIFMGNSANLGGGVCGGTATNCTFTSNLAGYGGGISSGTATNCVFWGNSPTDIDIYTYHTTVTYSLLSTQHPGNGNIIGTPRFVNPWAGDFRLRSDSPGIDVGTQTGAPASDILGRTRPEGVGIDMGAYEYHTGDDTDAVDPVPVLRVNVASTATHPDGLTWATAYPTLQAAANDAHAGYGTELWIALGTYTAATGDAVVHIRPCTAIYGGFTGTETTRDQRSTNNALTIIDGQGARRGIVADGCSRRMLKKSSCRVDKYAGPLTEEDRWQRW